MEIWFCSWAKSIVKATLSKWFEVHIVRWWNYLSINRKKFKVSKVNGNITYIQLTCMLTYKMACQNVVNEHVVKKCVNM